LKTSLTIDRAKAALLCIDLQEEHRKDSRYLVEGFDVIVERVQRIQETARAVGVPVFHSAYVVDTAKPGRPFHPVMANGLSAFSDVNDPLSAICPEIGPAGDEMMLIKTDASTLAQGDVPLLLRAHGVEWIFVVGVWTEACIAATVKDAVEMGFRVVLVKDACGSGSTAMHQTAVLNIANRLYGGAVTDTEGACRLLSGQPVEAWRVQGAVPLRFTYEDASRLYAAL
jgi:nicotinamidase-related amidase